MKQEKTDNKIYASYLVDIFLFLEVVRRPRKNKQLGRVGGAEYQKGRSGSDKPITGTNCP